MVGAVGKNKMRKEAIAVFQMRDDDDDDEYKETWTH